MPGEAARQPHPARALPPVRSSRVLSRAYSSCDLRQRACDQRDEGGVVDRGVAAMPVADHGIPAAVLRLGELGEGLAELNLGLHGF